MTKIVKVHTLSDQKLKAFKQQIMKGNQVNPYKKTGIYGTFVQALINLGTNKKHAFLDVKDAMQTIMGQKWQQFENKQSRNSLFAKDVNGRIMHNATTLQRVSGNHPYGKKLQQLGMCIDIYRGQDQLPIYQLRSKLSDNCIPYFGFSMSPISLDTKTVQQQIAEEFSLKSNANV